MSSLPSRRPPALSSPRAPASLPSTHRLLPTWTSSRWPNERLRPFKRAFTLVCAFSCVFALVTGCADFEHLNNSKFEQAFPPMGGGGGKPKPDPNNQPPDQEQPSPDDRKPGPCVDLDPAVIATCLDATGGVSVVPLAQAVLVAERRTGNIMLAKRGPTQKAALITTVAVDSAGDGGLIDIAATPQLTTDGSIMAYISTSSDNRVVRVSKDGPPKNILVGIPHGDTGNSGSIAFGPGGALYVLTGDAGNPEAANDPDSLAGKILRIDPDQLTGGAPAEPQVIASGIGAGGALCFDLDDSTLWYTNRSPDKDELLRLQKGSSAPQLVWSWPERPGIAGCAVKKWHAFVSLRNTEGHLGQLVTLAMPPNASGLTAEPKVVVDGKYGLLGRVGAAPDGMLCFGTVNKESGGSPKDVDDRVVCSASGGGGGGGGKIPGFNTPDEPKDD